MFGSAPAIEAEHGRRSDLLERAWLQVLCTEHGRVHHRSRRVHRRFRRVRRLARARRCRWFDHGRRHRRRHHAGRHGAGPGAARWSTWRRGSAGRPRPPAGSAGSPPTPATNPSATDPASPLRYPTTSNDGIEFVGVDFRYPGTDIDVLRDIDLTIPAGAIVAIVGDNGAGKSTLVKLLARCYEPTSGSIRVDGVDLRRFGMEDWRQRLSAGLPGLRQARVQRRPHGRAGRLDTARRRPRGRHRTRPGCRRRRRSPGCPMASTPSSAGASPTATSCRVGSGRSWRSAGR